MPLIERQITVWEASDGAVLHDLQQAVAYERTLRLTELLKLNSPELDIEAYDALQIVEALIKNYDAIVDVMATIAILSEEDK